MSSDTTPATRGRTSKHWSEEIVARACEEIEEAGGTPTPTQIRRHLDIWEGSNSTVQRYLRMYQTKKIEAAGTSDHPEVPAPIATALASLWDSALTHAETQVKEQQEQLAQQLLAIDAERADNQLVMQEQEDLVEQLQWNNRTLETEIDELKGELQHQVTAFAELSQEKRGLERQLVDADHSLELEQDKCGEREAEIGLLKSQLEKAHAQAGQVQLVAAELAEAKLSRMGMILRELFDDGELSESTAKTIVESLPENVRPKIRRS